MAKVVKNVVRGVGKVVKGVVKVAKNVVKSPIGKLIAGAALTYFGMPMIQGAIQGAQAGSGFLGSIAGAFSGAGAGLAGAASTLGDVATGLISGQMGLGQAGSALYGAMTGGGAAAAPTSIAQAMGSGTGAMTGAVRPVGQGMIAKALGATTGAVSVPGAVPTASLGQAAGQAATAGTGGLLSRVMDTVASPAGLVIGGRLLEGYGQSQALKDQWKREAEERDRRYRNLSVGNLRWERAQ